LAAAVTRWRRYCGLFRALLLTLPQVAAGGCLLAAWPQAGGMAALTDGGGSQLAGGLAISLAAVKAAGMAAARRLQHVAAGSSQLFSRTGRRWQHVWYQFLAGEPAADGGSGQQRQQPGWRPSALAGHPANGAGPAGQLQRRRWRQLSWQHGGAGGRWRAAGGRQHAAACGGQPAGSMAAGGGRGRAQPSVWRREDALTRGQTAFNQQSNITLRCS